MKSFIWPWPLVSDLDLQRLRSRLFQGHFVKKHVNHKGFAILVCVCVCAAASSAHAQPVPPDHAKAVGPDQAALVAAGLFTSVSEAVTRASKFESLCACASYMWGFLKKSAKYQTSKVWKWLGLKKNAGTVLGWNQGLLLKGRAQPDSRLS